MTIVLRISKKGAGPFRAEPAAAPTRVVRNT